MASGIFAVLDDIASLMDDVAATTKIATRKTAGILGDDLAVNAEKATGFVSSRELPVLWAITKGSFLNKVIILPIVFLLNYFFPVAIDVVLILGGLFLAYEGVEKIVEFLFHKSHDTESNITATNTEPEDEEKAKIKSAITTDFILSLEIVIIALGTAKDSSSNLMNQIVAVSLVAIIATIGVYGLVALIVRMDDAGWKIVNNSKEGSFGFKIGNLLIKSLPIVIKILGIVGTIALILVSGGILSHNALLNQYLPFLHHFIENWPTVIKEAIIGLGAGTIVVLIFTAIKAILPSKGTAKQH